MWNRKTWKMIYSRFIYLRWRYWYISTYMKNISLILCFVYMPRFCKRVKHQHLSLCTLLSSRKKFLFARHASSIIIFWTFCKVTSYMCFCSLSLLYKPLSVFIQTSPPYFTEGWLFYQVFEYQCSKTVFGFSKLKTYHHEKGKKAS